MPASAAITDDTRLRILELHRRQIDGDADISGQLGRIDAGPAQHPVAELDDQAGFFGERNEIGRRDQAALRMVPAHQGFERDDLVAGDVADRLIVDFEFVALQRRPQVEFQQAPGLRAGIHPGFEEAIGAAAVGLGAIEREIGILQEFDRDRCRPRAPAKCRR